MAQPSNDDDLNQLLAALIAAYVEAEQALLGGIAGILRITSPDSLARLLALARLRRLTNGIVGQLDAATARYAPPLFQKAIEAGKHAAEVQLAGLPPQRPPTGDALVRREPPFDFTVPHGVRSVEAIRRDLESPLLDVRRRITRLPDDIYKVISPAGAAGQAIGRGYTPAQAQAYAWREYVRRGVVGFTDRSGRDWSLSAYTEMSVRTATTRAHNAAHLEVMQAAGIDLFSVPSDGNPCPLCFVWQHRILSVEPDPRADATIEAATAAGLFHPNCKHTLIPFIPGVTVLPKPQPWTEEMANQYALTQKQRRLELEIRKAKKALEYAATPDARQEALADVRTAQARMRAFITDTGFLRQSRREQLDLSNPRLKLPQ